MGCLLERGGERGRGKNKRWKWFFFSLVCTIYVWWDLGKGSWGGGFNERGQKILYGDLILGLGYFFYYYFIFFIYEGNKVGMQYVECGVWGMFWLFEDEQGGWGKEKGEVWWGILTLMFFFSFSMPSWLSFSRDSENEGKGKREKGRAKRRREKGNVKHWTKFPNVVLPYL